MLSDGADLTRAGNAFQALAAATGKARSPSVERLVVGTSSVTVSLDRVCRLMSLIERCDGRVQPSMLVLPHAGSGASTRTAGK